MNKGFTLIEVLVAIAILSGVSIVLSQSFFSISRANTKSELVKDIKQSGDFSVRVMEQMIRSNAGVVSSCTTSGTTSKSIQITNPNGLQTTFGCVWDSANNISRLASQSGSTTFYMTPINVTLGGSSCNDAAMSLSFICTSYPSQPNSVKISFTLSQAGVPPDRFERASIPFQTTVNARN